MTLRGMAPLDMREVRTNTDEAVDHERCMASPAPC